MKYKWIIAIVMLAIVIYVLFVYKNSSNEEKGYGHMRKGYTKRDLEKATKMEYEHAQTIKKYMKKGTSVKAVAQSIAQDHLEEHPDYYRELSKMEKKLKSKK